MSAARARKILFAAIAISLLIHLLLAGYIRWPLFLESREEPVAHVHILRVARRTPPPPPTPPPTPQPTPAATPVVHASLTPPKVTPRAKASRPNVRIAPVPARSAAPRVTARPLPTPSLAPSATPAPCGGHLNAAPAIAATPDAADLTPQARASKVSGTAAIRVALDSQGRVTAASVAQSTGDAGLDAAAVQMARDATYTPKYDGCKAVAGAYTFTVKFVAW